MHEAGIDLSRARPQRLTAELGSGVNVLVTMGCGDECPLVAGARVEDWPLPDPRGQPPAAVRTIRDDIRTRVADLMTRDRDRAQLEPDRRRSLSTIAAAFITSSSASSTTMPAAAFSANAACGRETQLKIWIGSTVNGDQMSLGTNGT